MSLLVGLTGGIATGKSTVADHFRELGAHLVDADKVSRELVRPHSPTLKKIEEIFGPEVITDTGHLDRKKLSALIFADERKRKDLENILHPAIAEAIDVKVMNLLEKYPEGIIMVDAAIMIEVGRHRQYELLIVVFIDEQTQLKRLMDRNGLDEAEARRRISTQMPISEKISYSDYAIDNGRSPEDTREAVEYVFEELEALERAKRRSSGTDT